jgi:aminoglycoside phosphotransferase (APT) family kinase protein
MEHVPGTPLWQVYETADQATQDRLTQVFVAQLLALHTLDPQLLAPETTLAQPYEFIEHELDQLRIDSQHSPHTTLMEIVQWLEQRKATVPCMRPAILHRDYHPWNVLIDTAERAWVIDWDWQIGDARFDLAWTLMLMRRSGFDAFSTAVHDHYAGQSDRSLDALAYFEVLTTVRWLLNVTYAVESEAMPPAATADFRRFLIEPVRHAEAFLQERTGVAVAISL